MTFSFTTSIENFLVETEADVQAVIADVSKGVTEAEAYIDDALTWVVNNTPTIVADIESVIGFAAAVGATTNPTVAAAVAAAQAAITALNAVAAAKTSGASDVQTLLAGYTAIKQASASASATAAAATIAASPSTATPAAAQS